MASRGIAWSNNEVKALIAIWSDDKIQEQLDGAVRNKAVFEVRWWKWAIQGTGCNAGKR